MATDATGTPTAKGIPKFNTAVDAPSGKGSNAQMDAIDTLLDSYQQNPAGIATGEASVWNGSAWARSSTTRLTTVRPQDLGQDGATTGQPLVWDGGKWAPGSLVLDRVQALDIAGTGAETTLYSKSISGNQMGTDKMLRLTMFGDILHNSGTGTSTATIKIKFGGTIYFQDSYAFNGFDNANRIPWGLIFHIANLGATNSQAIWGNMDLPALNNYAAPTTGIGDIQNATFQPWNMANTQGAMTVDTTTAQTLDITITWSTSSASNSFRRRVGILEIV